MTRFSSFFTFTFFRENICCQTRSSVLHGRNVFYDCL